MCNSFFELLSKPFWGVAWLSSVRVVKWQVRSWNERNPCLWLTIFQRDSYLCIKKEEGRDNVKSSWPLCTGLHTCYNGKIKGKQRENLRKSSTFVFSTDWKLQLAFMKEESLVIVNQHVTVNMCLSFVHTAHHMPDVFLTGRYYSLFFNYDWQRSVYKKKRIENNGGKATGVKL